jgi:hypothetical protein
MSTLSITLIQGIIVRNQRIISIEWDFLLIGVVITIASLIRTIGIALIITLGITQIISGIKYKKTPSLVDDEKSSHDRVLPQSQPSHISIFQQAIPYIIFFCVTILWKFYFPVGGESYLSYFKGITFDTVTHHVFHYLESSFSFYLSIGIPFPALIFGATVPLFFIGAIQRYRLEYPSIIFCAITLVTILIWPFKQDIRFLFPMFPFFISFSCTGLESFYNNSNSDRFIRRCLSFTPAILLILSFLYTSIDATTIEGKKKTDFTQSPFAPLSQDMFSFIENNTEEDTIIIFFKPRVMTLMTDRQSIRVTDVNNLFMADYLCIYSWVEPKSKFQIDESELIPLESNGEVFILYQNEDFKFYRLTDK